MTPTQRSLKYLRDAGWTVAIVEIWNPHVKIRQDLFGFADLMAIHPYGQSIAMVQVTSTGVAERVRKILNEPRALKWLMSGGRIFVHGWRKLKKRKKDGSYSKVYKHEIRELEMDISDFWQAWLYRKY